MRFGWFRSALLVLLLPQGASQFLPGTTFVTGTEGLLELVTDQNCPIRLQAAVQNPKGPQVWVNFRNDSGKEVKSVTFAIVIKAPTPDGTDRRKVWKQYASPVAMPPDGIFLLEIALWDVARLKTLPPDVAPALGVIAVEYSDKTSWRHDLDAKGAFERLPPPPSTAPASLFDRNADPAFAAANPRNMVGCQAPVPTKRGKPNYTVPAAMAGIQGDVAIDAIVKRNGSVGETRITRSLDPFFGLDDAAVTAAREWRFTPASCQGKPVDMAFEMTIEFRLH